MTNHARFARSITRAGPDTVQKRQSFGPIDLLIDGPVIVLPYGLVTGTLSAGSHQGATFPGAFSRMATLSFDMIYHV
jgi:hypothetical protein